MSIFKRAMDYLGLGADDAYDDYDMPVEPERPARAPRQPGYPPEQGRSPRSMPPAGQDYYDDLGVRPVAPRQTLPSRDVDPVPARRSPSVLDDSSVQPRPTNPRPAAPRQGATVRPVPAPVEPTTVRPRRFDQAQEVADRFKEGQPVIMNLEGTEREVSRRLIDFASGLCYGLNGTMEKVATGVYLLKPRSGFDDHRDYDH
jgi:cell division inhibitor SepF